MLWYMLYVIWVVHTRKYRTINNANTSECSTIQGVFGRVLSINAEVSQIRAVHNQSDSRIL